MAMKFIKTLYATGRPSEYFAPYAEFPLKEALPVGTLVALEDGNLVRADKTKVPVGVVHLADTVSIRDKQYLDGERETVTLKAGTPIPLYKHFLMSGADVKGTLTIGAPVYLDGEGASAELTCNKPQAGFVVGSVERVTDKLVRFDLSLAGILKLTAQKID